MTINIMYIVTFLNVVNVQIPLKYFNETVLQLHYCFSIEECGGSIFVLSFRIFRKLKHLWLKSLKITVKITTDIYVQVLNKEHYILGLMKESAY